MWINNMYIDEGLDIEIGLCESFKLLFSLVRVKYDAKKWRKKYAFYKYENNFSKCYGCKGEMERNTPLENAFNTTALTV